jgi:ClpP class serine protease
MNTATPTTEIIPKALDGFLAVGNFEIDPQYGVMQLGQYLESLSALQMGVPYEKLGIEKARSQKQATVIQYQNNIARTIGDSEMLADTAITPRHSIAHLKLSGTMRSNDFWCNRGVDSLVQDIQAAFQNDHIIGIVLETNTGGGESVAGQILNGALRDAPKPVVVWSHFLASAGIMGTLPASEIIASTSAASFGSIGTFVTLDKRIAEWYNRNYTDVYAQKSSNKNRPFRALMKGDMSAIQEMVDIHNQSFIEEVQAFRHLKGTAADIAHTLSGEMFQANEAKLRGLVQGVGGFQYAIKRVMAHAAS